LKLKLIFFYSDFNPWYKVQYYYYYIKNVYLHKPSPPISLAYVYETNISIHTQTIILQYHDYDTSDDEFNIILSLTRNAVIGCDVLKCPIHLADYGWPMNYDIFI